MLKTMRCVKDYFSKYKFKYKEQVSKITFLRLVLIDSDNAPRINQETTNEKRSCLNHHTYLSIELTFAVAINRS